MPSQSVMTTFSIKRRYYIRKAGYSHGKMNTAEPLFFVIK